MFEPMTEVLNIVRNARVDTCPYDGNSNKTGFFIRIGPGGAWLSNVRRSPIAAWRSAAQRMRQPPYDEVEEPRLPIDEHDSPA